MKNKKGGKLKTVIAVIAVAAAVCALFTVVVNAVMTGTYEKLTDGLPEGKKYDCINEIEAAMKGMLAPKFQERIIGHAEVRETYKVSKVGTVCGCYCTDGKIQRGCEVRVLRDNIVIHEGSLASLRRFKDDVREVAAGYECGMQVEKFNDIKIGDVIECFVMEQIAD